MPISHDGKPTLWVLQTSQAQWLTSLTSVSLGTKSETEPAQERFKKNSVNKDWNDF